MAIDENLEQRAAEHRGKKRQSKAVPFLIRDDGMLFPNVPLIAKKTRFRPYHGDLGASLEDRMRYLQGLGSQRRIVNTAPEAEEIDIGAMDKEELVLFAKMEFELELDPTKHLNALRSEVAKAAGIDAKEAQRPRAKQAAGLAIEV